MFAIRANHAFDAEDFRAGGATVLVDDSGIVGVEPVGGVRAATVLPGLIDTHVHLVGDSGVMALERVAGYLVGRNRRRGQQRCDATSPPG